MVKIMTKLYVIAALLFLTACGLKKDLVRPSDIKNDDQKHEQPAQGGYGLL